MKSKPRLGLSRGCPERCEKTLKAKKRYRQRENVKPAATAFVGIEANMPTQTQQSDVSRPWY